MVAVPPDALVAALRELDPGARALLDLSLRHRFDDDELAEVMAVDAATIAIRRDEALDRLAATGPLAGGHARGDIAEALTALPREQWRAAGQPADTSEVATEAADEILATEEAGVAPHGEPEPPVADADAPPEDEVAAAEPAGLAAAPADEEPPVGDEPELLDEEVEDGIAEEEHAEGFDAEGEEPSAEVPAAEVDAAEHPTHARDGLGELPAEEELELRDADEDEGEDEGEGEDREHAALAPGVAAAGAGAGAADTAASAKPERAEGERKPRRLGLALLALLVLAAIALPFVFSLAAGGDDPQSGGGTAPAEPADTDKAPPPEEEPPPAETPEEEEGGGGDRSAPFKPVAGAEGRGTARNAGGRILIETAGLPAGRYQVWLYNSVADAVAIGEFQGGRRTELRVAPRGRLADFRSLDISLEPPEGSAAHSGESILRAPTKDLAGGG